MRQHPNLTTSTDVDWERLADLVERLGEPEPWAATEVGAEQRPDGSSPSVA